ESFVLRAGRHRVRLAAKDDEMRVIRGGRGLFVQPETESVGIVDVETSTGALDPSAPRSLFLTLLDPSNVPLPTPDVVRMRATGMTPVRLRVEALDGTGKSVMEDRAMVHVGLAVDPAASSSGQVSF